MNGKAQVFINDKFLGNLDGIIEDLFNKQFLAGNLLPSHAMLYCPSCGLVWARILFEHGYGWQAHCVKCRKCKGSGTLDVFPLFNKNLDKWSKQLLIYELMEVDNESRYRGLGRAS